MANKTLLAQIKQRSDTAANWTAKDPIISNGELIIVETNAGEKRFKVGDGEKTFTQLPYADENILSKIKTYTAGDGISISDTGVISSTGGGSGSDVFGVEIDDNNNITTSFDDIKNAIQNHLILMRNYDGLSSTLIGAYYVDTTNHNDVIQLFHQVGDSCQLFTLQRPSESTTVTQSLELFFVPTANFNNSPASGAAYWNASNKEWEIKDINQLPINQLPYEPFILEFDTTKDPVTNNDSSVKYYLKTPVNTIWNMYNSNKGHIFYILLAGKVIQLFTSSMGSSGSNYHITFLSMSPRHKTIIAIDSWTWESAENTLTRYGSTDLTATAYKAGNGISISDDGTISVTAAKIYSGTNNAPSADLGENGDIYIQTEG